MKRTFYLFILAVICTVQLPAQESYSPGKVARAAIFDKSIPLKDMPVIAPQQIDNSWKDGIIENESLEINPGKNSSDLTDPMSVQQGQGNKMTKGPIVNINGTGNVNGVYPPDTDGDVGPNHYIQMINLSFAIYDKSGNKLYGPVANSTLWSGFPGPWTGTNDGDPVILYDEMADRWVASQFAVWTSNGKYYELVAVSETSDPMGSWYRYAFEFDIFPDYPKLSVWPDGYYATFHMFDGSFEGSAFVAFEREKMLIGDPDAQMVYFGEYGSKFGYLPADVDGVAPAPGTPCYFTGINSGGNHQMEIWEMTTDWDTPANSTFQQVEMLTPASFNSNISGIPQPGTGTQLDALNSMLMFRLPYRNFGTYSAMVCNHTVMYGGVTAVRWYELRDEGTGWYIYQQGTYQPDNNYRWMGSIAMGADGSIALGYSVSSSTVYPSVRYTGRTPDAPLGEMNLTEVEVATGQGSQTGISRWGDYSCMSVDPSEDGMFWFTTEYMKGGGWGTWITSFNFEDLQPPTVSAGDDATICTDVLFEPNASGQSFVSVLWETSGDGMFQNANILASKYLRGNGDIENGSVMLTLTAFGFQPEWETSDEVLITFVNEPVADAGNNITVAPNQPVYLDGSAENAESLLWTTNGDGSFDDASLADATYTPGTEDILNGSVTLTLTANAMAPCEEADADNLTVTIDASTGIQNNYAGKQVVVSPNPTNGIFEVHLFSNTTDVIDLRLTDITGKIVLNENFSISGKLKKTLDMSTQPQGIYLLKIEGTEINETVKIIKK